MAPTLRRLYWQVTALLLATHFGGWPGALPLAIGLTVWQALHFGAFRRTLRALDVQVRIGYAGLLMLGSLDPLWPIHLVQFIGVNALLVADYCLLARLMLLLPWNRGVPLSARLLRQALLTPPAPGAIHHRVDLGPVRGGVRRGPTCAARTPLSLQRNTTCPPHSKLLHRTHVQGHCRVPCVRFAGD